MSREITTHLTAAGGIPLTIRAVDEPGAGGANHRYEVSDFDTSNNPSGTCENPMVILFQNGTVTEKGPNGVTQEALLAVIIDRLRSFQKGPFSCKENSCALTHLEEAMHWLHERTRDRSMRGVEGRHEK